MAKSWRSAFIATLALFIVTRALTLTAFPIFNDEAIYLQYAQAMHDDWQKNKFISMNGSTRIGSRPCSIGSRR